MDLLRIVLQLLLVVMPLTLNRVHAVLSPSYGRSCHGERTPDEDPDP